MRERYGFRLKPQIAAVTDRHMAKLRRDADRVAYDAVRARGAELVAITPQSVDAARAAYEKQSVPFPMLADPDARVADAFGLTYTFANDLERLYTDVFSHDLAVIDASGTRSLPIPGHFVVAIDGTIVDAQSDPDYGFRPEPAK